MSSPKIVAFKRELEAVKTPKSRKSQRKQSDMKVDAYCNEHKLTVPEGVSIHKLFHDKGEPMHPDMERLFSNGIPRKGMTSLKSILYGHVLGKPKAMERYETFTHLDNTGIYGLKDDIVSIITDPFWRRIEEGQKFGSYTWDGYQSLVPNISQQYTTHGDDNIPSWLEYGINAAVKELGDGIVPIALEESIAYCKTDTNAGFPAFTSTPFVQVNDDGESFTVLNDELYSIYTHIAKQVWNGTAHQNLPAVLFKRIQPGEGDNSKKRIVECVSRGVLWAEAQIWRPILERMRTLEPYAGYMHYDVAMRGVIEKALDKEHVSSLDYSAYDALVGRMLRRLFLALANQIPSAAPLFGWCAQYYRCCPLLTPHGWIEGEHGLFSGMFGTSFGGSLLNRGLILGLEHAINDQHVLGAGRTINNSVHLAFGDDTVYAWDGSVQIGEILDILQSAGMVLNASKQEYCGPHDVDKFVMFQACYWRKNPRGLDHCVPVYPLVRCAARLAFVEYLDSYSKMVYRAGYKVDEIECPAIVGNIVSMLIAKLQESEHHPNISEFICRYQGVWFHNLNPLVCISSEGVLHFVQSHLSHITDVSVPAFLDHTVCKILIRGLESIDYGRLIDGIIVPRTIVTEEELRRKAATSISKMSLPSGECGDEHKIDVLDSINNSGLSEGLIESILLRLPAEALYA